MASRVTSASSCESADRPLQTHALVSNGLGDHAASPEQTEDRFRVDRRKLELMIASGEGGGREPWKGGSAAGRTTEESGEQFFQRIMQQTNTTITWPCKLKIGAKSKKDPHVKVRGAAADVARAKEQIVAVLDTKSNRVALKMDVPHTEHSHVIGKGGANIRAIMEETSCHIHFPDCSGSERRSHSEKSSQVSITGQPECVDVARRRIRATLPLVLTFELPPDTDPDSTSPAVQRVLASHGVGVSFRTRSRSSVLFCQVRGTQRQEDDVVAATEKLWAQWRGGSGSGGPQVLTVASAGQVQVTSTMDVAPQHHASLRGRAGANCRRVEREAGVRVTFPSASTPGASSSVVLSGGAAAVCVARRLLAEHLPLLLMFDVAADERGSSSAAELAATAAALSGDDVHVSVAPKARQASHGVKIRCSEGQARRLYEARRSLLGLDGDSAAAAAATTTATTMTQAQPVSRLLQDLQSQQQAAGSGGGTSAVDLRPVTGSLALSWSSQQLQAERNSRSNGAGSVQQQPPATAELQSFQFQRSFNEDIFGRSDHGGLKVSGLSDSFGRSSDGCERRSASPHNGPPPGIHTPPHFSPRPSPAASPMKTPRNATGSGLSNSGGRSMMEAITKLPEAAAANGPRHFMVRSSSADSQLSAKLPSSGPGPYMHPMRLQAAVDHGTALSQHASTHTTAGSSSSNRLGQSPGTHMADCPVASNHSGPTESERRNGTAATEPPPPDHDALRQKAAKAIQDGRNLTAEVVRTPTDLWTGHGFSKSSPEHVLREQLSQQQQQQQQQAAKFNPSMATMYEADDAVAAVASPLAEATTEADELRGSFPVPTDSAVKHSHYSSSSSPANPAVSQAPASFGSVGDSPSKKRPQSQTDVNWSLWQTWQRTASDQADAAGAAPVVAPTSDLGKMTAGGGGSTAGGAWSPGSVQDLPGLLSLLDLSKYRATFDEQEVDLPIFLTLNEADLKDIGVSTFGARRRMMLAINELKQVYQQQMESQAIATAGAAASRRSASAARPISASVTAVHQQHHSGIGAHIISKQQHPQQQQQQHPQHSLLHQQPQQQLRHHLIALPPHTSSSGTSGSGASISAPSSDCSNSEGSGGGGVLHDYLKSPAGHLPSFSTATPAAASGANGAQLQDGQTKSSFHVSQSSHW